MGASADAVVTRETVHSDMPYREGMSGGMGAFMGGALHPS
jgi:hypothetical protein